MLEPFSLSRTMHTVIQCLIRAHEVNHTLVLNRLDSLLCAHGSGLEGDGASEFGGIKRRDPHLCMH
jgi:hypothetical protein